MVSTINPLWEQMPLTPIRTPDTNTVRAGAGETVNPFTDIFMASVNAVKETDLEKTQMEYLMATGQLDNPALLTIASTKASLAVDLLVQLRNQAMDAYNKLTQINM